MQSTTMAPFSWVQSETYQRIFACLPDATRMRFVGGCVRNSLLNLPFEDVDFATSYVPEDIMGFFQNKGYKVIPTGIAHGTVTVLIHGEAYEITTLRRDVETDGRHARIAYTPLWKEDAERRDFTMNALYVDALGVLHDEVGGQRDLERGLVRFIGDPEQRIREDYLRILRFFRFWALYGSRADGASLEACCGLKGHLDALSSERITKEMLKMLTAKNPWPMLNLMQNQGFDPHVWGHETSLHALWALETLENFWGILPPLARLTMITGRIPERLTLSREEKKQMSVLRTPFPSEMHGGGGRGGDGECGIAVEDLWHSVYAHGVPLTQERLGMAALRAVADFKKRVDSEDGLDLKYLGQPQGQGVKGRGSLEKESSALALPDALRHGINALKRDQENLMRWHFPDFPLSGKDVMVFGVSGPEVGRVLQATRHWWIQGQGRSSALECLDYAKNLCLDPQKTSGVGCSR